MTSQQVDVIKGPNQVIGESSDPSACFAKKRCPWKRTALNHDLFQVRRNGKDQSDPWYVGGKRPTSNYLVIYYGSYEMQGVSAPKQYFLSHLGNCDNEEVVCAQTGREWGRIIRSFK